MSTLNFILRLWSNSNTSEEKKPGKTRGQSEFDAVELGDVRARVRARFWGKARQGKARLAAEHRCDVTMTAARPQRAPPSPAPQHRALPRAARTPGGQRRGPGAAGGYHKRHLR